jgi:mono/diheme cytochrome c family protein
MRFHIDLALVALVAAAALSTPSPSSAQTIKNEAARPLQSIEGADSYKEYCAVCHGPDAKGNGPAAAALKSAPPDLTTIAKRKGGFSASDVERRITGKSLSPAHGSGDMPIWGHVFDAIASDRTVSQLRVTNLVDYIKSIQVQ